MTVGTFRVAALVLVTAVLSSMLTAVWMSSEPDLAPPVEPTGLTERLDALIDTLSMLSARTTSEAPTPALPVERSPLDGDEAGQTSATSLEDIHALLQMLVYRSQEQSGGLADMSMRYPDANWPDLENLKARLSQNRDAVSRSQMFLAQPEVLELYGRPTTVTPSNSGFRWRYEKLLANDTEMRVSFYFTADGYVYQVR